MMMPAPATLARPKAARQDHRRNRLHWLYRQRQPIEQPRRDQKDGEAKKHTHRRETGNRHRPDDVGNECTKIAARAAAFQKEASCRRGRGTLRHKLQYQKLEPLGLPNSQAACAAQSSPLRRMKHAIPCRLERPLPDMGVNPLSFSATNKTTGRHQ